MQDRQINLIYRTIDGFEHKILSNTTEDKLYLYCKNYYHQTKNKKLDINEIIEKEHYIPIDKLDDYRKEMIPAVYKATHDKIYKNMTCVEAYLQLNEKYMDFKNRFSKNKNDMLQNKKIMTELYEMNESCDDLLGTLYGEIINILFKYVDTNFYLHEPYYYNFHQYFEIVNNKYLYEYNIPCASLLLQEQNKITKLFDNIFNLEQEIDEYSRNYEVQKKTKIYR